MPLKRCFQIRSPVLASRLLADPDSAFNVSTFEILERFSDSQPGKTFIPKPPSLKRKSQDGNCKYWLNTGSCPRKDCQFVHLAKDEIKSARQEFVQERLNSRAALQENLEHDDDGQYQEVEDLVSRHQRASVFADFLIQQFPEILTPSEKSGVILDVAGGRGDLAFELAVKRKIATKVFVIDPRGQKVRRWQQKLLQKLQNSSSETNLPQHVNELFNEELFEKDPIRDKKINLIIGLHPDEATEPLVDIALEKKIPFAVIPCCVFAHLFPHRKLRKCNSEPRTYEQFLKFLLEKSKDLQVQSLKFRGRDTVIFCRNPNNKD